MRRRPATSSSRRRIAAGRSAGCGGRCCEREQAVYERLDGIAGIPRSFGLVGGEYLALEYVAGPSLREHEARHRRPRGVLRASCSRRLQAMHAAGVAHGDLKRKDNIIVGAGERPYLIDFGIAVRRSATSALVESLRVRAARADGPERVDQAQVRAAHRPRDGARRAVGRGRGDLPAAADRAARARRARAVADDHAAAAAAALARAPRLRDE